MFIYEVAVLDEASAWDKCNWSQVIYYDLEDSDMSLFCSTVLKLECLLTVIFINFAISFALWVMLVDITFLKIAN